MNNANSKNFIITFRVVSIRRGKKCVFRRSFRGITTTDPGYFYCPYVPKFFVPKINR